MSKNYALVHCNVFDGNPNSDFQNDMTILVENTTSDGIQSGRITAVGKAGSLQIPPGVEVIDLSHKYVMPGLINAHVHLYGTGKPMKFAQSERGLKLLGRLFKTGIGKILFKQIAKQNTRLYLKSGVTTIRVVGEAQYNDVEIRNEIKKGRYPGPRLLASGLIINVTGGHGEFIALIGDSPWEMRKNVRISVSKGVDWIKICATGGVMDARKVGEAGILKMTPEEITAVCEEAHKLGLMVAAHVECTEGVRVCLKAGVDTIEHGSEMDDEIIALYKNNPHALRGFSSLVPTLHAITPIAKLDKEITAVTEMSKQNGVLIYNSMVKSAKQALENGINIAIGTDGSVPFVLHYNTWRELDFLVKHTGITPQQALHHATQATARALGIEGQTGSIEPGKAADLLVLDKNPIENLGVLATPALVVANGEVIKDLSIKKDAFIDGLLDKISIG